MLYTQITLSQFIHGSHFAEDGTGLPLLQVQLQQRRRVHVL
jgi:hypothetical protein